MKVLYVFLIAILEINSNTQERLTYFENDNNSVVDTSIIRNPEIQDLLDSKVKIFTDKRPKMQGLKFSFDILKYWSEQDNSENGHMAYYFANKDINTSLQIVISESNVGHEFSNSVIKELSDMYPGLKSKNEIVVSGKKGLELTHDYMQKYNEKINVYLNTITIAFFYKTRLIVFTYNNARINERENPSNVKDFKLLYSNLTKSIKILN